MDCEAITVKGGTMTTEGFIPHKKHPAGFWMPVKLKIKRTSTITALSGPQRPVRDVCGNPVYALPGGGVFSG